MNCFDFSSVYLSQHNDSVFWNGWTKLFFLKHSDLKHLSYSNFIHCRKVLNVGKFIKQFRKVKFSISLKV